ncbi:Y-family DNA polymerase, partial [Escherichia coli]|uniref:Y-family DNA polymerase n=1 Tax=Escherichia coli TaxID=562 RepID=UPI003F7A501C
MAKCPSALWSCLGTMLHQEIKVYSIDECFLKLTAYEHLFDLTVYAQDMRAKAWRWLG